MSVELVMNLDDAQHRGKESKPLSKHVEVGEQ